MNLLARVRSHRLLKGRGSTRSQAWLRVQRVISPSGDDYGFPEIRVHLMTLVFTGEKYVLPCVRNVTGKGARSQG